jgi:hypothetical protein
LSSQLPVDDPTRCRMVPIDLRGLYKIAHTIRTATVVLPSESAHHNVGINFPSITDGRIASGDFCELVRATEKVGTDDAYQRVSRAGRMPRSLSVLVIASSGSRQFFRMASMTGRRPGRELVGGDDLDPPAAHSRRSDVARLAGALERNGARVAISLSCRWRRLSCCLIFK